MATRWDDILTVEEVQDAALASSSAVEENPSDVVEDAVRDAQDRIATYLGMDPMVHRLKQGIRAHEWLEDETLDPVQWRAWADHQPAVEVQSPAEVTIRHDGLQFLRDEPKALTADYHAGWRRSDQTLSDLDGSNSGDLTDLTTEPPALPGDIRRTAIALTLFQIVDAEHGQAIGQMTQAVGTAGTITVQGTDQHPILDKPAERVDTHFRGIKGDGSTVLAPGRDLPKRAQRVGADALPRTGALNERRAAAIDG